MLATITTSFQTLTLKSLRYFTTVWYWQEARGKLTLPNHCEFVLLEKCWNHESDLTIIKSAGIPADKASNHNQIKHKNEWYPQYSPNWLHKSIWPLACVQFVSMSHYLGWIVNCRSGNLRVSVDDRLTPLYPPVNKMNLNMEITYYLHIVQ